MTYASERIVCGHRGHPITGERKTKKLESDDRQYIYYRCTYYNVAGHVTRARLSRVMNLLNLAPGIQEEILFLPGVEKGKDVVTERELREIVADLDWRRQSGNWSTVTASCFKN